jgi:hypothetical protein
MAAVCLTLAPLASTRPNQQAEKLVPNARWSHSPLGRGFLTGQIKKFEDLGADDYRRMPLRSS